MAEWITDLSSLQELTERLARTSTLDEALHELLRAGATLVGAQRGLVALEPTDGKGPERTVGLGLGRADIGHIETVPRGSASYTRLLDGLPEPGSYDEAAHGRQREKRGEADAADGGGQPRTESAGGEGESHGGPREHGPPEISHPDIATDETLDPRHREVAARLGYAASYAVPLSTPEGVRFAAAVWLYDEPAEPTERQRRLLAMYSRYATEHISRQLELTRAREDMAAMRQDLLPARLPRVPGVQLAVRHSAGPLGGGDWYDVLPLPEGALGLSVGGVTGSGPSAVAAMGRLRASLRAYAVMEGEDPVAVLSDLELLLRLTEPARSATALFGYAEPAQRRITIAGAGHCPPLVTGPERTEFVETTLSAPLGMLACWEAPSVDLALREGETLLLYSDGLLHRAGAELDRGFSRLHSAVAAAPPAARADPEALIDHVLRTLLPDGPQRDHPEDLVLLAARF
jgi:serine phosphatase RsbU (regulator of sigma subunit)